MASHYTWSETELYNKDGIQIFIVRANENHRVRIFKICENGETRKATREEVNPYIDPEYNKRQTKKEKYITSYKTKKTSKVSMTDWKEELNFTWA